MNATLVESSLASYIREDAEVDWTDPTFPKAPIRHRTPGLEANARYFSHPEWAASYLKFCHRYPAFRSRWLAATGPWDDKVVVDVGCGPGNVFASVGGSPKMLIGVDVAEGGLEMARKLGYTPLLADAQELPLRDGIADIVALNATLHHCDDMAAVLRESARLLKPGGVLVTDHDPQRVAWNFRGPARWAWDARLIFYLWIKKGFHRSTEEQTVALLSEIHHNPGLGIEEPFFREVLSDEFDVEVFPHNNDLGHEVLEGKYGKASRKFRIAQILSGLRPDTRKAALTLLCRVVRR